MPKKTQIKDGQAKSPTNPKIKDVENVWKRLFATKNTNIMTLLQNYNNILTNDPYLLNQRIKQLKTLPAFLSRDTIEKALINPENNEFELRTATRSMLYLTYPLYRMMMLYEGILTYRDYFLPTYVDRKEMDSPRFKSDTKFVDMWRKKLNAKKQFRRIVAEVLAEGKKAYYLRQSYDSGKGKENVDYVHFQDLPSDWYKIIKHSTESYAVVAFNFTYFWQAGTSLDQFPPIFKQYYEELENITEVRNGQKYIDPNKVNGNGLLEYNSEKCSWAYWRELPSDECFVFSFTESDDIQVSPFAALLLQSQDLSSYSLLQQQLLAVPLYSMILGEIPLSKENQSGSHIDDYALSPVAVELFEGKVNANMPPGTTYNMVPTVNNELYHFEAIPNANEIYDKGLQQMINTSGTSTLMTTTEKPSVAQVAAGKIIEKRYIDRMYEQFAWAVNIIFNNLYLEGDLNYRWEYRIFGDSFSEQDDKKNLEKSLSMGQCELLPKYLAYHDLSLSDALTASEYVDSTGIYDKFKVLVSSFNGGINNGEPGRRRIAEDQITNDNTAASVDSGQNVTEINEYETIDGDVNEEV